MMASLNFKEYNISIKTVQFTYHIKASIAIPGPLPVHELLEVGIDVCPPQLMSVINSMKNR